MYSVQTDNAEIERVLKMHKMFCRDILSFDGGNRAIINNGRLLGPLVDGEEFTVDDFSLLERFSLSTYVDRIFTAIAANTAGNISI